jgi:hypothetical protein
MSAWLHISALCFGVAAPLTQAAEKLFVFFPTTVRPHVLQKGISDAGPGLEVTAFGRFADFENEVKTKPPDAILSLPEVVGNLEGYRVAIVSKRNGDSWEPYFLMGVEKAVELSHIGTSTIGIVDFLGHKGMQKFMAGIFQPSPTLKTVAKVEDLLPLLTFRMAEGILVTQTQVDYFRSVSHLSFVTTPVPNAKAGTICLAVRKDADAPKAIQAIKGMDSNLRKLLGDVKWD